MMGTKPLTPISRCYPNCHGCLATSASFPARLAFGLATDERAKQLAGKIMGVVLFN